MADKTGIQWTDATWNPTIGCSRVSDGCRFCYAFELHDKRFKANRDAAFDGWDGEVPKPRDRTLAQHARALGADLPLPAQYDVPFSRVQLMPDRLDKPLHWQKPRRIFVDSMSDLFHEDVPDEFIADVYAPMIAAYWHIYQVLTKRPERRPKLLTDAQWRETVAQKAAKIINGLRGADPVTGDSRSLMATNNLARWNEGAAPNIWEGTSAEDQAMLDERVVHLLATPAAVRFLSLEPLLGPVTLCVCEHSERHYDDCWLRGIHWAIDGGESGPHARPYHEEWGDSIRHQCAVAGVAYFHKQHGSNPYRDGVPLKLHSRHGSDPEEWPEDLRVREFPV